jgi:hypothetical protein
VPAVGYVFWILGALLELSVVVCAFTRHSFRRYLFLNLYLLFDVAIGLLRFYYVTHFGWYSDQYRYCYYYSDAVLTIFLYLALISLYLQVFDEMKAEKFVRLAAVILLGGTALFSYAVIEQSHHKMLTAFAYELSQNLYFVGLVLTYVLWGAILKLRETRIQLIQLVLSLGVYFSAFAATFAFHNVLPQMKSLLPFFLQVMGCLLPVAWGYAFLRLSPDARMVPARLAVVPR